MTSDCKRQCMSRRLLDDAGRSRNAIEGKSLLCVVTFVTREANILFFAFRAGLRRTIASLGAALVAVGEFWTQPMSEPPSKDARISLCGL